MQINSIINNVLLRKIKQLKIDTQLTEWENQLSNHVYVD